MTQFRGEGPLTQAILRRNPASGTGERSIGPIYEDAREAKPWSKLSLELLAAQGFMTFRV